MGQRSQYYEAAKKYVEEALTGSEQMRDHNYSQALSNLENALAESPEDTTDERISDAQIRIEMARIYKVMDEGHEFLKAVECWHAVLLDENAEAQFQTDAYNGLASAQGLQPRQMIILGDYAAKKVKAASEANIRKAWYEAAVAHYNNVFGDKLLTKQDLEKPGAARHLMNQAIVQDKLGSVHEAMGNFQKAAECFHKAFQWHETTIRVDKLREILGKLDKDLTVASEIRQNLVAYYMKQGDDERVQAEKLIARIGTVPTFEQTQVWGTDFATGKVGYVYTSAEDNRFAFWKKKDEEYKDGIGRYEMAMLYYDQVLALDPNNKIALWHKAGIHIAKGQYDEALKCYDRRQAQEVDAEEKPLVERRRAYVGFLKAAKDLYNSEETDPVPVEPPQEIEEAQKNSEEKLEQVVREKLQPLLDKQVPEDHPDRATAEEALENFKVLVRGKAVFFYSSLRISTSYSENINQIYNKTGIKKRGQPFYYESRNAWYYASQWDSNNREFLKEVSPDHQFFWKRAQAELAKLPIEQALGPNVEVEEQNRLDIETDIVMSGIPKSQYASRITLAGKVLNILGAFAYSGFWGSVGVYVAVMAGLALTPVLIAPAVLGIVLGNFLRLQNPEKTVSDQTLMRSSLSSTVFAAVSLTIAVLVFGTNPFSLIALAAVGAGVVFGLLVYAAARWIDDILEARKLSKAPEMQKAGGGGRAGEAKRDDLGADSKLTPPVGTVQPVQAGSGQPAPGTPGPSTSSGQSTGSSDTPQPPQPK